MSASSVLLRALDRALDAVGHAERRGLRTRADEPAVAELERLRKALTGVRDRVRHDGWVDAGELGTLVRDVASWTPDSELKLIAALGAVVQAARRT